MLRGLNATGRPLYCDTDSIICDGSASLRMGDTELGAWKFEGAGTEVAIAGKKMYAVFDEKGECVKKAHKGAKLTGEQIRKIALGECITVENPGPVLKFDGTFAFTKRRIRRTA